MHYLKHTGLSVCNLMAKLWRTITLGKDGGREECKQNDKLLGLEGTELYWWKEMILFTFRAALCFSNLCNIKK